MIIPNMSSTAVQKLLKVAIVGLPNAGKSTLINSIMSMVICPVSKRVHTTRTIQHAALLKDETQVVFVDTPGLVNMKEIKKFAFPQDFVFGPEKSIVTADVVAVIHDVSNSITRHKLDPRIKGLLEKFPNKNSILILNKVDTIKSKGILLDTVRILTSGVVGGRPIAMKKPHSQKMREQKAFLEMDNLLNRAKKRLANSSENVDLDLNEKTKQMIISAFTEAEIKDGLHKVGWPNFHDVFMISALNGDGINLLKDYFVTNARSSQWMFDEDFVTDVPPTELAIRVIKSILLDKLPQEIPYKLEPKIEFWEENEKGELRIIVLLKCSNPRYVGRVMGTGAVVIQSITSESETILSSLLRVPVNLTIKVYADEIPVKK